MYSHCLRYGYQLVAPKPARVKSVAAPKKILKAFQVGVVLPTPVLETISSVLLSGCAPIDTVVVHTWALPSADVHLEHGRRACRVRIHTR